LHFPEAHDVEHHQSETLAVRLLHWTGGESVCPIDASGSASAAFCSFSASSPHTHAFVLHRPSAHWLWHQKSSIPGFTLLHESAGGGEVAAAAFATDAGLASRIASAPHAHIWGLQPPEAHEVVHHQSEMLGVRLLHWMGDGGAGAGSTSAAASFCAFCCFETSSPQAQAFVLQRPSTHWFWHHQSSTPGSKLLQESLGGGGEAAASGFKAEGLSFCRSRFSASSPQTHAFGGQFPDAQLFVHQ
jgi:hypothetical protein